MTAQGVIALGADGPWAAGQPSAALMLASHPSVALPRSRTGVLPQRTRFPTLRAIYPFPARTFTAP